MRELGHPFAIHNYDIERCFPNMPKEAILHAAMEVVAKRKAEGKKGVWIPQASTKKPAWIVDASEGNTRGTWMLLKKNCLIF